VYRDANVPAADDDFEGQGRAAAVLRYLYTGSRPLAVQRSGGDTDRLLEESSKGMDAIVEEGSGLLTPETAAPTGNMSIVSDRITESGAIWRVAWRRGDAINFRPVIVGYPSFRRNDGPWIEGTHALVKVKGSRYLENVTHYVIPEPARPASISDRVEARLAAGIVKVTDADFNQALTVVCNNQIGVEQLPLPAQPRHPIASNYGAIRGNKVGLTNLLWSTTKYGVRTKSILPNGIPSHSTDGTDCLLHLEETGSPIQGIFHCLWKGSSTSALRIQSGYQSYHPTVGTKELVTGPDGQSWFKQTYDCKGTAAFAFAVDGRGPDFPTNITDAAVVYEGPEGGTINLARWQAGKLFLEHELRKIGIFQALRFMDEMQANNGNIVGMDDVVPMSYVTKDMWINPRTHSGSPPDSNLPIIVTAIEEYAYPDPETGFFAPDRTIAKLTLERPKDAYGLRTGGATLRMFGFLWDRTSSGPTTRLNGFPWVFDCEGDPADPLPPHVVIVSAGPSGKLSFQDNQVNPHMELSRPRLFHPDVYAKLASEFFEANGRYPMFWLCKPLTMDYEAWAQWIGALDESTPSRVELVIEWVNEVWNTAGAFQGQTRYMTGMARRLGKSEEEIYVENAIRTWKTAKAACKSGRRVALLIAGQAVVPNLLARRMEASRALLRESFASDDIIMSVSNYFDDIGYENSPTNAAAAVAAGPAGLIDCYDVGYRDLTVYTKLKADYGKPLWAYEGGASWQAPTNYGIETVRTIFSAVHHPRMRNVQWGAFSKYQNEGGFDVLSVLAVTATMEEGNGKNWGTYKAWDQQPGIGDGSDGKFSNLADMSNYIQGGSANSRYTEWVSPRGAALIEWVSDGPS
jgi:hypothetical protein